MNPNKNKDQMLREFMDFLSSDSPAVPPPSTDLRERVTRDVAPAPGLVLAKFASLFAASGAATLSICPQFGLGPLGGGHGISHYFMSYGTWACALFCGVFFFGTAFLASLTFLTRDERRILSPWRYPVFAGTALVAFGSLFTLGRWSAPEATMFFQAEFIAIWLLSGLVISIISVQRLIQVPSQVASN